MATPKTNWKNPKAKVAGTHFTVGEVLAKSGYSKMPKGPMVVGFLPGVTPRRNAAKQARFMEELRHRINRERLARGLPATGIRINSWARSWQHNKQVGGATFSKHLFFLACDITLQEIERLCPWKNGRTNFDMICNEVFKTGGFGQYPRGARHVDSRGKRARWTSF